MNTAQKSKTAPTPEVELLTTGNEGFDHILAGGLPANRLYLVQGEPGTGKTTLALQFLMEGARLGEKTLYITFSETKDELLGVAKSHGWDLKGIELFEMQDLEEQLKPESQNTVFHPSEVEMSETTELLLQEIERVDPKRIVFDSVSEMRMLAETPLRYRRQMLRFKQIFSQRKCTVLFLDDLTSAPRDLQVQSIVHGVFHLQKVHPEFGEERRRIHVVKLRGRQVQGGLHDYAIRKGGLKIFPRVIAAKYVSNFEEIQVSSGVKELDLLVGGGLQRGTSNLYMGPAGTGKSTIAFQYAYAAAERGEKAAVYIFEESIKTLTTRMNAMGKDLERHLSSGRLFIQKVDPAELSPGEFADEVRRRVLCDKISVVVVDSLNGYMHAMPGEDFLVLQLHELLGFLGNLGVVTVMVLAQQGLFGTMRSPIDLTYLADTVFLTRYFESKGTIKRAVSVIKKRAGSHEDTIREFKMNARGISVGEPLVNFQGIMTGVPQILSAVAPERSK